MASIQIYDVGDRIKITAVFTPTDPTVIKFDLYNNNVFVVTHEFGVSPDIVRNSEGSYTLTYIIPTRGRWTYRVTGTGVVQATEIWFFIASGL